MRLYVPDLDLEIEKSNGKTIATTENTPQFKAARREKKKCNHRVNRKMERETKMKSNNKFEVKSNTKRNVQSKNEQFIETIKVDAKGAPHKFQVKHSLTAQS